MNTSSRTKAHKRILLVRLGGFGDVVFTLPAVHLVRTTFPEAEITFLVYREFAPLLEGFKGVDSVLTLDRARYRTFNPFTICAQTVSLLKHLALTRFALAVDFQGFGETAFLSWFTRAPERWGSIYRPGREWAYTRAVSRNPQLHPIDYHLDLLRQAGGMEPKRIHNDFVPPEKAIEEAREFFARHNLDVHRPTMFIQPFTSTRHKTWPLEHFIAIAQLWRKRGVQILFGGGPGDKDALEPVSREGFAVSAGASPLLSASLVKLSMLVVGGDTGLMHLAVAMEKRIIMIMLSAQQGACIPFGHRDWAIVPAPGLQVATVPLEVVEEACRQAFAQLGVR